MRYVVLSENSKKKFGTDSPVLGYLICHRKLNISYFLFLLYVCFLSFTIVIFVYVLFSVLVCYKFLPLILNLSLSIHKTVYFVYPPASEARREVAIWTERKNLHSPYMVWENLSVCLSVCDEFWPQLSPELHFCLSAKLWHQRESAPFISPLKWWTYSTGLETGCKSALFILYSFHLFFLFLCLYFILFFMPSFFLVSGFIVLFMFTCALFLDHKSLYPHFKQ